ncbi:MULTISPECIES: hypothetical protein [Vibrio]|nr:MULTISPECIES: hypothetical protein [Vibrio]MCW4442005.1 hypothetical protein [Vibrio splendidus]MDA0154593.1 hypothetical protein [Vibrio sp. Makdt]
MLIDLMFVNKFSNMAENPAPYQNQPNTLRYSPLPKQNKGAVVTRDQ